MSTRAVSWRRAHGRDAAERLGVAAIILAAAMALLLTAPTAGDFWWSDAPRHALNGAFVKDLIAQHPLRDPAVWAMDYYLRYPSLTILFYPPLFYLVEAAVFAVLGVTHFAAQATVSLFVAGLGLSAYGFARLLLPRWSALGVALLAMGAPEVTLWGRQVMLDVPAFAVLVGAAWAFARYCSGGRPRLLHGAVLLLLAAAYIKIDALFLAPALVATLFIARGPAMLRDRHVWLAGMLGVAGLAPIALLTLKFGQTNLQSVAGRQGDLSLLSTQAWTFYARLLPAQLGGVAAVLGVTGLGLLTWRRPAGVPGWMAVLLLLWLVVGYAAFSAIGVREPRHTLMILFPLMLGAALALHRVLPTAYAQAGTLLLGGGTFIFSLALVAVPTVAGYAAVADYVAAHAGPDAVVLFSGYRDGNFVFDLRTHEGRRDIATVRADKLLLRVAVERARGVGQAALDQGQIAAMLRHDGVSMVLYQPGFWEDLREMQRLSKVLHSPAFRLVTSLAITGAVEPDEHAIEVYEPTYPVTRPDRPLTLDLPIIGHTITGSLRQP